MDIYMFIVLILFITIILYKIKKKTVETVWITDKEQTVMIRAICCIIVVLVHIPKEYGNFIQDSIGSFGYIAVTIFFMLSAYGLKYSIETKKDYLKKFWKNRILTLLIPFWNANIISVILKPSNKITTNILRIIGLNGISFITILLLYYILFWIIYTFFKNRKTADYLLCGIVFLYSILGKAMNKTIGWQVESMGFIYGSVLYYIIPKIGESTQKKCILFGIMSLILGLLYLRYKDVYMIGTWCLKTILGISIISFMTIILNKIEIKNNILKAIGNISYEVYLLCGIIMRNIFKNVDLISGQYILLVFIVTFISAALLKLLDSKIIHFIKTHEN